MCITQLTLPNSLSDNVIGLDRTHNPEFTTCEFYQAFANIEDLIGMSESLIRRLSQRVAQLRETKLTSLPAPTFEIPPGPFPRIDFIPALEAAIERPLPTLSDPTATTAILDIFDSLNVARPDSPSLPHLLDRLSSVFLEPQCTTTPKFITNLPECLAPLSKSHPHPSFPHQRVSARVELFIQGREILNAYEEENSPFEQRRKFEAQLANTQHDRDGDRDACVDESYLEALEWGLPPTGGWGCGVDRLVMLFTGASRIADVRTFGNLRNVVALGTPVPAKGTGKTGNTS
jgi:lysyl-tRNA synthetase class 2